MFNSYLAKLNDIALSVSWESFVELQHVQAELQNGYTSGTLTHREMRVLYDVSTVLMNNMRQELHKGFTDNTATEGEPCPYEEKNHCR